MNSLQFNLSRALGPLLAGATLAAWGSFWCFLFNALSFLPLIWILGTLRDRQKPAEEAGTVAARLREGFAYVRRDRLVLVLLTMVAATSFFGYSYVTLMPMLARMLYGHDDAHGLGVLMGAIGVGALAAALALSLKTPARTLPPILSSLVLFCFAVAAVGYVRNIAIVCALLAICGGTMVVGIALCNTSIQHLVPDLMRGRVLGMYTFCIFAVLPFGNLFIGIVAEHRGLPITLAAFGGTLLVSLIALAAQLPASG